ncbi:hypothetical protein SCOCK_450014 [Actinacidiphila cocklensis]|uniref:Uncharacterized protein n=1 Tax=Actinacidiphila cocklensis TaxID=887465 RepID=A0A9W4GTN3_9ACTN|nr:hypothetical protein SCOCK_450014 [Actinacidiphila cocklensis]
MLPVLHRQPGADLCDLPARDRDRPNQAPRVGRVIDHATLSLNSAVVAREFDQSHHWRDSCAITSALTRALRKDVGRKPSRGPSATEATRGNAHERHITGLGALGHRRPGRARGLCRRVPQPPSDHGQERPRRLVGAQRGAPPPQGGDLRQRVVRAAVLLRRGGRRTVLPRPCRLRSGEPEPDRRLGVPGAVRPGRGGDVLLGAGRQGGQPR